MADLRATLFKTGLDVMHALGAHRWFGAGAAGSGVIFTLHHIRPRGGAEFHPNRILEVTPDFLNDAIAACHEAGVEPVSLADAIGRLGEGAAARRFAVFTIDDGYADNVEHALPVFERWDCPFTVFITPKIIEGSCELWWLALEQLIRDNAQLEIAVGRDTMRDNETFRCDTLAEKAACWRALYWKIRGMGETAQRAFITRLCNRYGLDLEQLCLSQAMSWDDVRKLNAHRLATIGAHSVNHYALGRLSEAEARIELETSRDWIAEETGTVPDFFAYPYGDPKSAGAREFALAAKTGYRAAVTTRKGVLFAGHNDHLTALPRVSLNGDYQARKYVELYLTGAPFALANGFRRVNVDTA